MKTTGFGLFTLLKTILQQALAENANLNALKWSYNVNTARGRCTHTQITE